VSTPIAAEPGITELFPGDSHARSAIGVEAATKVSEERGELLGPRDRDHRGMPFVFVFPSWRLKVTAHGTIEHALAERTYHARGKAKTNERAGPSASLG